MAALAVVAVLGLRVVELVAAQTALAQADRDYTGAVFAYHDTITNLEALVGASLRN